MAVDLQPKHSNFISRSVTAAQQFKTVYDSMVALRSEWDALGYASGGTAIVDGDFVGNNIHLNAADLGAFYTSQGNLATYWGAGNSTNVCKMIP